MADETLTGEALRFWEAVGADGPVPIGDDLEARISQVLTKNPEFIRVEDVDQYILYSGSLEHGGSGQAVADLTARTEGAFGTINMTDAGKALEPFARTVTGDLAQATETYGRFVDFGNVNNPIAIEKINDTAWNVFKPASAHFVHEAQGNIVTVTSEAKFDRVYAQY